MSEAAGLRWRDLQPRDEAGQATVFGKRGKTRAVLLPASVWRTLAALRGEAGPDVPVFPSGRGGGCLDRTAVHRIVKSAVQPAGLPPGVSAHWMRHAHASHALDRGALPARPAGRRLGAVLGIVEGRVGMISCYQVLTYPDGTRGLTPWQDGRALQLELPAGMNDKADGFYDFDMNPIPDPLEGIDL